MIEKFTDAELEQIKREIKMLDASTIPADEVKRMIKESGVAQYQIAEYLRMSEYAICRKLRDFVSPNLKKEIINAINAIKESEDK